MVAYYAYKILKTPEELFNNLFELVEGEFRYKQYPFNLAKKMAILNDIKQINSYVIENAFDDVLEKKWQKFLNDFIYQTENTIPLNGVDEIRQIDEDTVIEIVKMIIFLICRNPEFNCLGIFPNIKQTLLDILLESTDFKVQMDREDYVKNQMDALWFYVIYKALYNVKVAIFTH